jgi:outer membrane protein assembly factor BamB
LGPTAQLTSTPVIGTDIYITAPDGFLYAIDFSGRPRWRTSIGAPWGEVDLVPSPVANVAVYAVTPDGGVASFNSDGTFKWRFAQPAADGGGDREPIFGSPALVNQQVEDEDPDNPGTTRARFETIVYVVNGDGTLYGVRDRDGTVLLQDRCSVSGQGCLTNADCPMGDETCERLCQPSGQACIENEDCPDGETCGHRAEVTLLEGGSVPVRSSVVISADLFAIAGTDDGRLCARRLDGSVPDNERWASGCVVADEDGRPITSSPVMDRTSRVYVIAGGVLHAVE